MKKALLMALTVVCVIVAFLYGSRVQQVNAAYPERHAYAYSLGEEAVYANRNLSSGESEIGAISITAHSSTLCDYEEVKELAPGYTDSIVDENRSLGMSALVVDVTVSNGSEDPQQFSPSDCRAQSGAWMNGLYVPLYMIINGAPSSAIELEQNQSVSLRLIYLIYSSQVNNSREWERFGQRSFQLVLSLFPDKHYIDLGAPNVGDGQERGEA